MHLSRYWGIIFYRTLAGIKAESRQNYLGYFWYVLEPLISAAIFYFALSRVMQRGGPEYVLFLLIGLTSWQWYEGSCLQAATAIKSKVHILLHFDLPKFIFPLVSVLVSTWKFLWIFLVIVGVSWAFGHPPGWHYLYLPLILGCELLLIVSLALPLAVATSYVNDTLTVAASCFRISYFVSGIFFDSSKVPASLLGAFYLNPMAGILESLRDVLLENHAPNLHALLYGALLSCGLLLAGLYLSFFVNRRILKHVGL